MEFITDFVNQYGYLAIYLLLSLGIIGLPVPDEILMTLIGYLSHQGVLNYPMSLTVSFLGALTGMCISYGIGRKVGRPIITKWGKWIGLNEKRYQKVEDWFRRFGGWTIVFGYYIPGVRHVSCYISGISRIPFRIYVLIAAFGSFLWSAVFITIGYYVGVAA